MSEHLKPNLGNYQELGRGNGSQFPYVVGRFQSPGLYAVGVMDPTDPKSWSGAASDITLFFLITPEEYELFLHNRPQMDALASRIQEALPRSRYLTGIIHRRMDPDLFHNRCQELLLEDAL